MKFNFFFPVTPLELVRAKAPRLAKMIRYIHAFFHKGPVIFLWVGGGRWFLGGHPKIFELKGGGPSQKLKAEEVFTGKCTVQGKIGVGGGHAKFFRDNQKPSPPYP